MAKTPKTEPRSLTTFLRRLRPFLGGNVKKIDDTSYRIDGKVDIEVNYFCGWNKPDPKQQEKIKKTCYPASVTISFSEEHINEELSDGKNSWSRDYDASSTTVCRTRTIQRNKSGDISFDSIAVAMTKVRNAVDHFVLITKQRRKFNEEADKKMADEVERLSKIVPVTFKPNEGRRRGSTGFLSSVDRCQISIHAASNEDREKGDDSFRYQITFGDFVATPNEERDGIDYDRLKKIIEAVL